MTRKRIILHVGYHKTGTTYLQNSLGLNSATLAELGVLAYQDATHRKLGYGEHALALSVRGTPHTGLPLEESRSKIWNRFRRAIEKFPGKTVVNSSEVFMEGADKAFIRAQLRAYDVNLVIFVREQTGMLGSLYGEIVKHGLGETLEAYYDANRALRLDYFAEVERWAAVFGRQNMIVRDFDRVNRSGDLFRELLRIVGVEGADAAAFRRPSLGVNARQPAAVVELLRVYNTLPVSPEKKSAFRNRIDTLVAAHPELTDLPGFEVPEPLQTRVREESRASNERLSESYAESGRRFFESE